MFSLHPSQPCLLLVRPVCYCLGTTQSVVIAIKRPWYARCTDQVQVVTRSYQAAVCVTMSTLYLWKLGFFVMFYSSLDLNLRRILVLVRTNFVMLIDEKNESFRLRSLFRRRLPRPVYGCSDARHLSSLGSRAASARHASRQAFWVEPQGSGDWRLTAAYKLTYTVQACNRSYFCSLVYMTFISSNLS